MNNLFYLFLCCLVFNLCNCIAIADIDLIISSNAFQEITNSSILTKNGQVIYLNEPIEINEFKSKQIENEDEEEEKSNFTSSFISLEVHIKPSNLTDHKQKVDTDREIQPVLKINLIDQNEITSSKNSSKKSSEYHLFYINSK